MNRWSRIVLALAAVATLSWLYAGATGFRVNDDQSLALHTLISFAALLALVLTHTWVAVFVVVSERLIRRRGGCADSELRALAQARRRGLSGALASVGLAVSMFALSNALIPGHLDRRNHLVMAVIACLAVVGALLLEAQALSLHGRATRALEA